MSTCEMCGKEDTLVTALIENVELNVCSQCASFGKIIKKPLKTELKKTEKKTNSIPQRELILVIREDYSKIIKEKREKMGLKQDEFAKFLNEKESLIQKMETGSYVPSIELARKLEKQLNITLVEEKVVEPQNLKAKEEVFTIGDAIKIKN